MIDEKESKLIRKTYVRARIGHLSVILIAIFCVLMIILEMLDDLVFHQKTFQPRGLYTTLIMIGIFFVLFTYCAICAAITMKGKRWRALQHKLSVRQEQPNVAPLAASAAAMASGRLLKHSDSETAKRAGGVLEAAGAVASFAMSIGILAKLCENAAEMARAYNVPLPRLKTPLIVVAIAAIAIVVGSYIPQFVSARQAMQADRAFAAKQIGTVSAALSTVSERVYADDPEKDYSEYGYSVSAYLPAADPDLSENRVHVSFDESGVLTDVHYYGNVDPNASLEDNLARIQADFDTLNAPLSTLDVRVADDKVLSTHTLSDAFKEQFLAGTLYKNIEIHEDVDAVTVYYEFDTEEEADFDEYSRPQISLWVNGD